MNDETFRDFVLDQLQLLGEVHCRRMFGSYGLYHDGVFFGILSQGRLYFKTTAVTRGTYVQRGMQPFRPNPRQTLKSYYSILKFFSLAIRAALIFQVLHSIGATHNHGVAFG